MARGKKKQTQKRSQIKQEVKKEAKKEVKKELNSKTSKSNGSRRKQRTRRRNGRFSRDVVSSVHRSITGEIVQLGKRYVAQSLFPDLLPPIVGMPDAQSAPTSLAKTNFDYTVPVITDSTVTSAAYCGIALSCFPSAQFYYISAVSNGVFTWTAVVNPKQSAMLTSADLWRQASAKLALRNVASLSTLQGRWIHAYTSTQEYTAASSTSTLPVSVSALAGLKTSKECAANLADADGVRATWLPYYGPSGPPTFFAADVTPSDGIPMTYLVWVGSSSATIAPAIIANVSAIYEYIPFQSSEFLYQLSRFSGSNDEYVKCVNEILSIYSRMGCTGKDHAMMFSKIFGRKAPSQVEGGTDSVGIAATEMKSRVRAMKHLAQIAETMVENKQLDISYSRVFDSVRTVQLPIEEVEDKVTISKSELRSLVQEMAWLTEPVKHEEKRMRVRRPSSGSQASFIDLSPRRRQEPESPRSVRTSSKTR